MNSYQCVCVQENVFVINASHEFRALEKSGHICILVGDTDTYTTSKFFASPSVEGMLPVSWLLSRSLHI